jgi:murein DD-endopeptidase MepM/ murein hydrolase activator NlpD
MATSAARALISFGRISWFGAGLAGMLFLQLPLADSVDARSLYKYRSAEGHWVYSDRRPNGLGGIEPHSGNQDIEQVGVWLRETTNDSGEPVLVAVNDFETWVQIAYRVESSRNLNPSAPSTGNSLVPPLEETFLMELAPIEASSPVEVSFSYQYLYGHPGAHHRPEEPYRLPYASDDAHTVSQAYPDVMTHATDANRYAIDFEMPVGTKVFAARGGLVIETQEDFTGAGLDPEFDVDRANYVRILHDDGTLALYGHLSWHSLAVQSGDRVRRGQYIAASGNTGFSSGPHLHFVVQLNRAGAMESVPVRFAGAQGTAVSLQTGDRPVAY